MAFFIYINSHFTPYWSLTAVPDDTPNEFSIMSVNAQTNRAPGTYYWYVEHITSSNADFEYNPPSITSRSTFTVTSLGVGYNTGVINLPPIKADGLTEGPETFLVHVSETISSNSAANILITIQDTFPEALYVDAGVDQTLLGQSVALLDGFYSGNVSNVTIDWIQVFGPTVIIGNVNALQSNITIPPGATGFITMRLYANYGLPTELYDDVKYFLLPQDDMGLPVGAIEFSGPESTEFTVSPWVVS